MQTNNQSGFTILELTLAMTFLAFVLVFSATVVVQLSNVYVKGLTMKQINQAGRTMTDDLSRSLQSAAASQVNTGLVGSGLLCVGKVAYIWNPVYIGSDFNDGSIANPHRLAGQPISLARTTSAEVGNCADPSQKEIAPSTASVSLLSNRTRVLSAEATRSQTDPKLVHIKLTIGSHDPSEASSLASKDFPAVFNSAHMLSDGSFTCRETRFGNYCAFAEFHSTIYVTR